MLMNQLIEINGQDGGGQILRTALSLAMITGQPFRMINIRGQRPKPGLMRQHLTCVKAACEISDGSADGTEIGSTELVFRAGEVRGSSYHFTIGTAGSTSLLFQTLLPALLHAKEPSTLRLEGGTHNPMAPPFEFLDEVFLPAIRRMDARAEVSLTETGFAPAGGGVMESSINPIGKFLPLDLHERGELESLKLRVPFRALPEAIAHRILNSALEVIPCEDAAIDERPHGPGRGVGCLFSATFTNTSELASAWGEHGVSSESVGARVGKSIKYFLSSSAPVGRNLADQLLLPMALAGQGSFTTTKIGNHVITNIAVIEKFLPVKFVIESADQGCNIISVS